MRQIDFVVTYVNGNDSNWLARRASFLPESEADNSACRYRDWDTLKYWFRGVEAFAPFVRKVFFVTDNQVPEWLNLESDKLCVVNHTDFIPKEFLPTFNSNVIEMFLHKIEGLSDTFVYFNDDMFITAPVKDTDFFKKGLPCGCAVLSPVICYENGDFSPMLLNNAGILNTHFEKNKVIKAHPLKWFSLKYGADLLRTLCMLPFRHFTGFYETHMPTSFLRSSFDKLWDKEGEYLAEQCKRRFRNNKLDINQWLIKNWQFCEGNFYPRSAKFGASFVAGKNSDAAVKAILSPHVKIVCINDADEIDFEKEKAKISSAFEKILSKKSSFEKEESR